MNEYITIKLINDKECGIFNSHAKKECLLCLSMILCDMKLLSMLSSCYQIHGHRNKPKYSFTLVNFQLSIGDPDSHSTHFRSCALSSNFFKLSYEKIIFGKIRLYSVTLWTGFFYSQQLYTKEFSTELSSSIVLN